MDKLWSGHLITNKFGSSRRWGLGWLLALIIAGFVWGPFSALAAVTVPDPEPSLYVLDQAGVMSSETKTMIIKTSQELAQQTKAQVAVVTLKSLNGQTKEDVALEIGRKWQLGDKQLNNGVVILVVPPERAVRIEVGYGLEGALPDGKVGRILDEYMLPAFQANNFDQGLVNGYSVVVAEVAKEYGVSLSTQPSGQTLPVEPASKKTPTWLTILGAIGLIFLLWLDNRFLNGFLFGMLLSMFLRGGGRGGGGGFGGGSSGGGGSFGGGGSGRNW